MKIDELIKYVTEQITASALEEQGKKWQAFPHLDGKLIAGYWRGKYTAYEHILEMLKTIEVPDCDSCPCIDPDDPPDYEADRD